MSLRRNRIQRLIFTAGGRMPLRCQRMTERFEHLSKSRTCSKVSSSSFIQVTFAFRAAPYAPRMTERLLVVAYWGS